MSDRHQDVYTSEELARAAGVPVAAVESLIAEGALHRLGATRFIARVDAVAAGRRLRAEAAERATDLPAVTPEPLFDRVVHASRFAERSHRVHAFGLLFLRGALHRLRA